MALRAKAKAAKSDTDPEPKAQQPDEDPAGRIPEEDKDVIDMSSLSAKKGAAITEDDVEIPSGDDLVEVDIDGKKVKVTRDARDTLTSFLTRSVSQTRVIEKESDAPPSPAKTEEKDDLFEGLDDKDLFIQPAKFLKEFAGRIEKKVEQRVEAKYNADQGQKQFWRDFYSDNKNLEAHDSIVKTVLNENLKELGVMPVKAASKKLAELTQAKMLDIVRQFGGGDKGVDATTRVEGATGGERTGKRSVKKEDERPTSLSGIIKKRQASRRAARQSLH